MSPGAPPVLDWPTAAPQPAIRLLDPDRQRRSVRLEGNLRVVDGDGELRDHPRVAPRGVIRGGKATGGRLVVLDPGRDRVPRAVALWSAATRTLVQNVMIPVCVNNAVPRLHATPSIQAPSIM